MRAYLLHRLLRDKAGFTLIEGLFAVALMGLVIVSMTPFLNSVYKAWDTGDRKTILQQNARVGMEMVTSFFRQAKRIIKIPVSGRGNFIEFRDPLDTYTMVIFHNIATSEYFIGDQGLIKSGDLVLAKINQDGNQENALLARSIEDFRVELKDFSGAITDKKNKVTNLEIFLSLKSDTGDKVEIISISSSVALRSEVRINKPTWVAANNSITELLNEQVLTGFLSPKSISINTSDGSAWVADTGNNRIRKISSNGVSLLSIGGFNLPASVSVNSLTGECWVADTGNDSIKKISASGAILLNEKGYKNPLSVSVDIKDGACWVADTGSGRVQKISSDKGQKILDVKNFSDPVSVSANSSDGSCWVADTGNNRIKKINSKGKIAVNKSGYNKPMSVSANSLDATCWVADTGNNSIKKLASNGGVKVNLAGFSQPMSVSVDSREDYCWVADSGNDQVIRLDPSGNTEFRIGSFNNTLAVGSGQ